MSGFKVLVQHQYSGHPRNEGVADRRHGGKMKQPAALSSACSAMLVVLILLTLTTRAFPADTCDSLSDLALPITETNSQGEYLCWAATAQMAMSMFPPPDGKNVPQCEQANKRFGEEDCCPIGPGIEAHCDRTGWPEFSKYEFHALQGNIGAWSELLLYLCKRRTPILYAYRYKQSTELHMKIAYGFQILPNQSKAVLFIDPGDPVGSWDQEVLVFDTWFMGGNQDIHRQRDYIDVCPNSYLVNGSCTTGPPDTRSPGAPLGLTIR